MKFLNQTIYKSDIVAKIDLEHWKHFDEAVKTNDGFKIGDFIEVATRLTCQQMVDFLDEIKKLKTIKDVHKFADERILELSKEIKIK